MTDLPKIRERHTPYKNNPGERSDLDGLCAHCLCIWPCDAAQLLALLAATPSVEPAGLDVERLFEAMYAVWPGHTEGSGGTGNVETQRWEVKDPAVLHRGFVKAIAAEYAALLPTQASDSPEKTT